MKLDRVTITGADDSIAPGQLFELSERYPFVEWGILVSRNNTGTPRYPSAVWIDALQDEVVKRGVSMKLSLHICGSYVRNLLLGINELPVRYHAWFERIQLNFHAERTACNPPAFYRALSEFGGNRQFIFQLDGALGNKHFEAIRTCNQSRLGNGNVDAVPLFDVSGGAGVLPAVWPPSIEGVYMGYAGGLGPQNLTRELPLIDVAACGSRYWIDMETHVRSNNDELFDLSKVDLCLRIAERFING